MQNKRINAASALALGLIAMAVVGPDAAAAINRSQEKSPSWSPPATADIEKTYPHRVGRGLTPFRPVAPNEVPDARNPQDAARRIDASNRSTTPYDLDVYRKDAQPGVGYSKLLTAPKNPASDSRGRSIVERALGGANLNTDPSRIRYLNAASASAKLASLTRSWQSGFGDTKFIRLDASGKLTASVGGSQASHDAFASLVGSFFGKSRELAGASLKSIAPASPTSQKSAALKVTVLGFSVVNETISDRKPFVKNLAGWELLPMKEWWSGSVKVPWLGFGMAFKMNSDPLELKPRLALGNCSAAGELALETGLETLGEVPLASLWGFAEILARIHFKPVAGSLFGGNSVGIVWDARNQPLAQDARYVRTALTYGAVNLKIKARIGFSIFGFSLFEKDKTLFSVFKHDGWSSNRDILSSVRETRLR